MISKWQVPLFDSLGNVMDNNALPLLANFACVFYWKNERRIKAREKSWWDTIAFNVDATTTGRRLEAGGGGRMQRGTCSRVMSSGGWLTCSVERRALREGPTAVEAYCCGGGK